MPNKISYREINIIKYSCIAFVFVAISIGIIYFLARQITSISSRIHDYNNESARYEEGIALNLQLTQDMSKIGPDNIAKLQNALVFDENISDLVQIIDALAQKYSVSHSAPIVSGITPASTTNGGLSVSSVDYSLQMTASIDSVIKYLKELETNPNFISTASIRISGDMKTGWDDKANVNITGKIYYKNSNQ